MGLRLGLIGGLLLALLPACSSYRPVALESEATEAMLAEPLADDLVRRAGQLQHPLIAPVTLDFSQALSLDAISLIAVVANPDLTALRLQQQVADAQVFASGLFPDPQLSLSVDRVLSPSGEGLITGYMGGLTLDALSEVFVHRRQVAISRSLSEQLHLDIAWAEWNTAGTARVLASRLSYQQAALQLARQADDLAAQTLQSVSAAVAAATLKGEDLQAQTQVASDAAQRAANLQRDTEDTRQQLNQLLGLTPSSTLHLTHAAPLTNSPLSDLQTAFTQARRQRLDLQALAKGQEAQQQGLQRALLGQYPRVGLSLNRGRDTSAVNTWGPALSLDLPLWNRNRGEVAVSRATAAQLQAEYAARLHQTRADIAQLLAALHSDEQLLQSWRQQSAVLSRLADAYAQALALGAVSHLVADTARLAAWDSQLKLLDLEQACREERIGLSLLTGEPFP